MSAIGHWVVFRLTRWSWRIQTGFLGPRPTWDALTKRRNTFALRDSHPLWSGIQADSPMRPHLTSPVRQNWYVKVPQPRPCNARRLSHMARFSPIRVRSPLLTESLLFSLPAGTEMFHFPAFPPRSLCVQLRVAPHDMVRGFPIRKSWSQRPVIDSTRLIADSHVLLRLPMPRHPPCALKNLTTNKGQKFT